MTSNKKNKTTHHLSCANEFKLKLKSSHQRQSRKIHTEPLSSVWTHSEVRMTKQPGVINGFNSLAVIENHRRGLH